MNSASLCSLAGRYDNLIPPRFLVPIDSLKIPSQNKSGAQLLYFVRSICWGIRCSLQVVFCQYYSVSDNAVVHIVIFLHPVKNSKRDSNRFLEDFWDTCKQRSLQTRRNPGTISYLQQLSKWDTLMQEYNKNNPWIFLYIYFLDASLPIFNKFFTCCNWILTRLTNIIKEGLEPGTAEEHHGWPSIQPVYSCQYDPQLLHQLTHHTHAMK